MVVIRLGSSCANELVLVSIYTICSESQVSQNQTDIAPITRYTSRTRWITLKCEKEFFSRKGPNFHEKDPMYKSLTGIYLHCIVLKLN